MGKIITLEDYNTQRLNMVNEYYEIDPANNIGTHEFSDVKLDFCICGHSINGDTHTFTFQVMNKNWNGTYYFCRSDGAVSVSDSSSYSEGVLTITSNDNGIKLYLYLCSFDNSFNAVKKSAFQLANPELILIDKSEIGVLASLELKNVATGEISSGNYTLNLGVNSTSSGFKYLVLLKKSDLEVNPELNTVIVGKVNKVYLDIGSDFLPDGTLVGSDPLTMEVVYNDTIVPVQYDTGGYYFSLDLTSLTSEVKGKVQLNVYEDEYINPTNVVLSFNAEYLQVDNFTDLVNEIYYGTQIIKLTDDFTLYGNIPVNHNLVIYGQEHIIDCNSCGFIINSNCNVRIQDIEFTDADTLFTQKLTSNLTLTGCKFTNCQSIEYNNLGAVVYCDVDLESLTDNTDFTTLISECSFIDNYTPIFHGGELEIMDCEFENTDDNYIDSHNPNFIYLTDGTANISNSSFKINISTDFNIGFAQALFYLGETALINNSSVSELTNNRVNWSNAPYSNVSSTYCEYEYTIDNADVTLITKAEQGKENDNYCYMLSNDDKIYKINTTITRGG